MTVDGVGYIPGGGVPAAPRPARRPETGPAPGVGRGPGGPGTPGAFGNVLDEVLRQERAGALRFSAHAERRLAQRRIRLGDEQQRRLEEGVARAEAKGAKEAVVMVDRLAFVVSVKNRTVITVADEVQLRESVFTNIDSVVFA